MASGVLVEFGEQRNDDTKLFVYRAALLSAHPLPETDFKEKNGVWDPMPEFDYNLS